MNRPPRLPRFKLRRGPYQAVVNGWIETIISAIERALTVSCSGIVTLTQSQQGIHIHVPSFPIALAKTGGSGIAARSGAACSSGAITLQMFNVATGNLIADAASTTDKAYNFSAAAGGVGANKYVIVIKIWSVYWIVAEECP